MKYLEYIYIYKNENVTIKKNVYIIRSSKFYFTVIFHCGCYFCIYNILLNICLSYILLLSKIYIYRRKIKRNMHTYKKTILSVSQYITMYR